MTVDTLWYTRCPAPSAASIAIRKGWLTDEFRNDGIEVLSLAAASDRSVHLSHYQHTQPNSFRFGGFVPPLVTRSRGIDVRVIGLAWPDRRAEVVVRSDSTIRSGQDLRGKRLGVPRRLNDPIDWWQATVKLGFHEALAVTGLKPNEVSWIDIPISRQFVEDAVVGTQKGLSLWGARSQFAVQREEAVALIRGEVDALYTDAAMGALLKASYGFRPVVDIASEEDGDGQHFGYPVVLTVSGGLLDERPDLVVRWIHRLLDAGPWARENVDESTQILSQDTGLPVDFLADAYSGRVTRQLDISLSESRIDLLKRKHDALLAHGFLQTPIDFKEFIDPAPLNEVLQYRALSIESR